MLTVAAGVNRDHRWPGGGPQRRGPVGWAPSSRNGSVRISIVATSISRPSSAGWWFGSKEDDHQTHQRLTFGGESDDTGPFAGPTSTGLAQASEPGAVPCPALCRWGPAAGGFDVIIAAEWSTPLPARQGPGGLARTSPRAQPRHLSPCGPNRVDHTIPASAGGFDSGHVRTTAGTYRARKAGDAPREATLTRWLPAPPARSKPALSAAFAAGARAL